MRHETSAVITSSNQVTPLIFHVPEPGIDLKAERMEESLIKTCQKELSALCNLCKTHNRRGVAWCWRLTLVRERMREEVGGACSGFRLPGWSAPRRRSGWRWVEWYLDALYCRRRSLESRSAWPADRRSSVEAVRFQEDDSKYRLRTNWNTPPRKKLKNKLNVSVISTNFFQIYVIFLYKYLEIWTFCCSSTEEEMSRHDASFEKSI